MGGRRLASRTSADRCGHQCQRSTSWREPWGGPAWSLAWRQEVRCRWVASGGESGADKHSKKAALFGEKENIKIANGWQKLRMQFNILVKKCVCQLKPSRVGKNGRDLSEKNLSNKQWALPWCYTSTKNICK